MKNEYNKDKTDKNRQKLTVITAYDALFSNLFSKSADMILVGDKLKYEFYGKSDTLSATLDQMIYHTKKLFVMVQKMLFVITDMPFATYINKDEALKNCARVYQETLASAVKNRRWRR